ncbi:MAG: amino acid permease, partial [Deltaproteobacteria bacterium]|nr:amino acid permease [Deltaproteobacteria bacterium]
MRRLEAHLELPAVIAISLSSMLGSGIFVLPGIASAQTGPSIWLAYVTAALCVLPAALSKAELAAAMPSSGGTFVYLDRAFGPLVGTVSGIGLWFSLLLKCAFALVGLGVYLDVVAQFPHQGFSLLLIGGIVLLNIRGVRGVSRVQLVLTALCLVVLSVLVVGGGFSFEASRLTPLFTQGPGGFIGATGFIFVSFAGVTKVAAIAEEIHHPERNLPRGILLSLLLVTFVYGSVTFVLVGVIPGAELATDLRPIHTLAEVIGGRILGLVTAVVGVLTLASMVNAGLLAASRFPFAMSRDDLLPAFLGELSKRHLTPVWSIVLSGVVIAVAILLLDVRGLAKLASAFMIMIYCSESVAVIALRETHVQWYTPAFRSPFYPMTQVFGVLASLVLLLIMGFTVIAAATGVAVAGALLFLFYGRKRTQRLGVLPQRGRRRDIVRSINASLKSFSDADAGEDAAVVVALFGSERSPEMLVELGEALREGGKLEVIHLTEIPEQTGLDALMDDMPLLRSVRRRVRAMADRKHIPLEFESLVSRDIVKSVDEITSRLHSEWLVIEWTGRSREALTIRNPLGWLRDHVSCNLAVFYDAGVRYLREILVHVEPNKHDMLVISTAKHLAEV